MVIKKGRGWYFLDGYHLKRFSDTKLWEIILDEKVNLCGPWSFKRLKDAVNFIKKGTNSSFFKNS